jgi:outer membrane protein assembly factor BamD
MHAEIRLIRYPHMKKNLLTLTLTTLVAGLLTACATTTDPAEAYKDETQQQIFQRGKSALEDKSYTEAIKRFEALDIQYPSGTDTEYAQLYLIYAYYMKEEYPLASSAADHFIRLHPASPNVDYAYYMKGLSDYYQNLGIFERIFTLDLATRDLTQIQKSYNDFNQLVTRTPNSRYAPSAHQYLIYLRNMMADHELQVGQYYYSRKAYVAAAERASNVVKHFEGAPAVKNALVLLVKSYYQLGETKLEQDTLLVLKYNYPNTVVNL